MSHASLPLNRLYLSHTLSESAFADDGQSLFYVKMADGRRSIVRHWLTTGLAQTVTAEPLPAASVGYGAGVFAVRGDLLIYAAKDKRLYGLDVNTGEQWPLTPAYEGLAAPVISPCGQFVAFIIEEKNYGNVLLCDVRGQALPIKVSDNPWYAFDPVFSADGSRLAWQEWNEYDMPWDEARLVIARFAQPTGAVNHPAALLPVAATGTLAASRVSFANPQFSPNGKQLAFISDQLGWRSVWVGDADGQNAMRLNVGTGEVGWPNWVPGQRPFRWSADGQSLFAVRRHASRHHLARVNISDQSVSELPLEWTTIESLTVWGEHVAFIGMQPRAPQTVVTVDTRSGDVTPRASSAVGLLNPAALSEPRVLSWPTVGNTPAWGIFYPAVGPQAASLPRPLIVHIHGGPTSEVPLSWLPQAQYFATRGWHYLIVNHRGGTGFGRAYQDLLNGQWGVVDVEDARTGAEHLIASGLADAQRLILTGGSAGGYTTLMALTQDPEFWAAGVSLYGVGDMYDLKQGSHRFEVNYEEGLIGRLPEAGPLWKARSPLTHVQHVTAPVLLFHGQEDKAVPYQQSVDFAEAVKRKGGRAELVLYPDEGHGFVKEANRRDMIEKMERFLDKYVLCLQK